MTTLLILQPPVSAKLEYCRSRDHLVPGGQECSATRILSPGITAVEALPLCKGTVGVLYNSSRQNARE